MALAGANRGLNADGSFFWRRDAIDRRIVQDVKLGTGKIIDDPAEVGGWSQLPAGTPYQDTDRDGMPDRFEQLYGFNLQDSSDGSQDADGDGYTNVEEFLNRTCPLNVLKSCRVYI